MPKSSFFCVHTMRRNAEEAGIDRMTGRGEASAGFVHLAVWMENPCALHRIWNGFFLFFNILFFDKMWYDKQKNFKMQCGRLACRRDGSAG